MSDGVAGMAVSSDGVFHLPNTSIAHALNYMNMKEITIEFFAECNSKLFLICDFEYGFGGS